VRQLEITGARAVRWSEASAPALQGDGEALVRPLAVAMCDLDAVFLSGVIPVVAPPATARTPLSASGLCCEPVRAHAECATSRSSPNRTRSRPGELALARPAAP
jgi:hypothetical protein